MARTPYSSPGVLLFELLLGSSIVGFTPAKSKLRLSAVPAMASCVYTIARAAVRQMRPRWASLFGGTSFAFFLQYIDIALLSDFEFEKDAATTEGRSAKSDSSTSQSQPELQQHSTNEPAVSWKRFMFGWTSMWSFRHVNTVHEVRNVPPFLKGDPGYVPSRWKFVFQRAMVATGCYLVLDLLNSRSPPQNPGTIFNSSLIPLFRRVTEVTSDQLKLRALSVIGFAITFYCIIQGYHSVMSAITVGLGLSKPESWRPIFGSIFQAYSVRNFWGKVWHQSLRKMITTPAALTASKLMKLPPNSETYRFVVILLTFINSGMLHYVAGLSSGAPPGELGVFIFFCTQAFGVAIELSAQRLYRWLTEDQKVSTSVNVFWRVLGYVWVMSFFAWSGPAWLYPTASRPVSGTTRGILPFSLVGALKDRYAAQAT